MQCTVIYSHIIILTKIIYSQTAVLLRQCCQLAADDFQQWMCALTRPLVNAFEAALATITIG